MSLRTFDEIAAHVEAIFAERRRRSRRHHFCAAPALILVAGLGALTIVLNVVTARWGSAFAALAVTFLGIAYLVDRTVALAAELADSEDRMFLELQRERWRRLRSYVGLGKL